MNFDHWKEAIAEEAPALVPPRANPRKRQAAPDFYRAYLKSETDPRRRKRAAQAGATLIPKAPNYHDVPPVTEPADAFIPPQQGSFVRLPAQEELV
jgi:hypothetical protein